MTEIKGGLPAVVSSIDAVATLKFTAAQVVRQIYSQQEKKSTLKQMPEIKPVIQFTTPQNKVDLKV